MRHIESFSQEQLDTKAWISNYLNIPFKHKGLDRSGLDCFNLCRLVYKEILNIEIPYSTQDDLDQVEDNWYNQLNYHNKILERCSGKYGWYTFTDVRSLKPFDIVVMSIGSTNAPNHTALYLPNRHILQVTNGCVSWESPYGRYYQQYTVRCARWDLDYE